MLIAQLNSCCRMLICPPEEMCVDDGSGHCSCQTPPPEPTAPMSIQGTFTYNTIDGTGNFTFDPSLTQGIHDGIFLGFTFLILCLFYIGLKIGLLIYQR